MNKIIVRRSTGPWLIPAGVGFAIMVSELIHTNYHINGIVLISAFVFISAVVQLLLTKPRVIIDEEGIAILVYRKKFLWKEIQKAELQYGHRSGDKITLIFHDNQRLPFTLFGVNLSTEEVYAEILSQIRKQSGNVESQEETWSEDDGDVI